MRVLRRGTPLLVATLIGAAASGAALASIPGPGGVISGCYSKLTGALRVIDASTQTCAKSQVPISWDQTGTQGPPGQGGPPSGPASGDLTGSYPSPQLASGVVGTSNVGTIPSATLEQTASSYPAVPNQTSAGAPGAQVCFAPAVSDTDGLTVQGGGSNGCAVGQAAGLMAPTSGEYLITAGLAFVGDSFGERRLTVQDVTNPSPNGIAGSETSANVVLGDYTVQSASTVVPLTAGETIELFASQNSGIALPLDGGDDRTYLTMTWLAPS